MRSSSRPAGGSRNWLHVRDQPAVLYKLSRFVHCGNAMGMSRPSALEVLRLIANSNFVGCSIGNSEAFAPLRILTTNAAARRLRSGTFGPWDPRPEGFH